MRNEILFTRFRVLAFLIFSLMAIVTHVIHATEKQLTLVFAGNMPDIGTQTQGTYTRLAGLLEKTRAQNLQTIFTFSGGSLGPSPLSSLDKGSHIIDILNTLEPDLMTLSKREFSYFEDELTLRSYEAAFPIVSSNLYDPITNGNLEGILSSLIVEKNNIKVGFIAILDEEVVEEYLLQRARVFEPRQIIEQKIIELKQKGAELIALVYSKEREYYQTLISDNKIDFALSVINGSEQHSSNKVYSIKSEKPIILLKIKWQSNQHNKNLIIDTQETNHLYPSHSTTSVLIKEYNNRLDRLLNQKIGFLANEIETTRALVRTEEVAFGNFITDALKNFAKTDLALINGGVIRGDKKYSSNTVLTRRDIATELPFRTHVSILNVTGEQLRQALENSISQVELAKGRFLQVSGLTFTYTIEKPVGERIKSILVNGDKLDLQRQYSIATTDYLANGGDGYEVFLNAQHQELKTQTPPLLLDIVIREIQQQETIQPKIEFRIKRVTE